jgi:hypothetical protein
VLHNAAMRWAFVGILLGGLVAGSGTAALAFGGASGGPSGAAGAGGLWAPLAPGEQADAPRLAFGSDGVLHLVVYETRPGRPGDLVYRFQVPGGAWSAPEVLTGAFAFAGPAAELIRHPDGSTCLFFDAWKDATDALSAGLYLSCRRAGRWEPATKLDDAGVTATFDAAFTPTGQPRWIHASPTRTIAFGDVQLWTGDFDAGWPRLAIDRDGRLHAAWGAFTNPFAIFTSRSADDGATWTAAENLTATGLIDVPFEVPFDLVADAGGGIHLLSPGSPSIYRHWSSGAWGPPVSLATGQGSKRLAVGADGLAVVAWGAEDGVYLLRETAGGAWGPPTLIERLPVQPTEVAVAVDANGGTAVVWTDATGISSVSAAQEDFASSVPSPLDITLDPVIVAESALLAAGVVVLIPFPAQLFNDTVQANYGEISGAFGRLRRRLRLGGADGTGFWRRPLGIATFFLLAAIISAFLDPTLRPGLEGLATIAGLLVGLVVVAIAFTLPAAIVHRLRRRGGVRIDVLPLLLPVAVLSVAVSRLTSFEPGYLYGLLAGVTLLGATKPEDESQNVLSGSVLVLALSVAAWIALIPIRTLADGSEPSLLAAAAEAALTTIVVSGLEGLLFGLLPIDVEPGAILFRARRRLWAVLFGLSVFAFFHVLVNPSSGYLVESARVPVATTIGLFVVFAGITAATWAWFRFRPRREIAPSG